MSAGPRHHGPKYWTRDRGDAVRWALRTLAQAFGASTAARGGRQAGNAPREGDGPGGANQDGSPEPRREDPSRGHASPATGGRPPRSVPAIGDSGRRREEARPFRPSWCPAGASKRCRMRGGFVGLSTEALCGEAPEGQPVIRRENLVTVGVEDPQGHPMIHGCPRPHRAKPSGKLKGRRVRSGPSSSQLTKTARKKLGAALPNRCMESGLLLGG